MERFQIDSMLFHAGFWIYTNHLISCFLLFVNCFDSFTAVLAQLELYPINGPPAARHALPIFTSPTTRIMYASLVLLVLLHPCFGTHVSHLTSQILRLVCFLMKCWTSAGSASKMQSALSTICHFYLLECWWYLRKNLSLDKSPQLHQPMQHTIIPLGLHHPSRCRRAELLLPATSFGSWRWLNRPSLTFMSP